MTNHKTTYRFELALTPQKISDYFALREQIFCKEQQLFAPHDRDAVDTHAYPIVAIAQQFDSVLTDKTRVVGVVRIYETEPRTWYGGRLGTHPDFRRGWRIGKGLINKAVTTANTWGCDRFLATVQEQNVRFFTRLHWHSLKEIEILGRPHHLMEADLNFYPATNQQRPSFPLISISKVIEPKVA
ncbi:MAG: MSMEG_0567/Sll0786 family nitrogen starvation N-acetyltransferase [Cyanobacteria bacterium J06614_10]